ncbi:hypothetical protein BHM03_00025683 [Ensete ventricosum]|nr:hypothetical protein BHM03_00025683 [Ensete ventricosum]
MPHSPAWGEEAALRPRARRGGVTSSPAGRLRFRRYRPIVGGPRTGDVASFLLPMQGDVSSPRTERRNIYSSRSPRVDKKSPCEASMRSPRIISRFSLFFSLFFFLPRLIPSEIDRYHPTTADDDRNRPLPTDFEW